MDEEELYRRLGRSKIGRTPSCRASAPNDPLYHDLDFRVQYELAIEHRPSAWGVRGTSCASSCVPSR